MLKRALGLIFMLMLFCSSTFAATISDDERQARNLLEQCKDMRYLFDAGVNRSKFEDRYQDLYINFRRFKEAQSYSPYYVEAEKAVGVYKDIAGYWDSSVVLTGTTYECYYKYLYPSYPGFKQRLSQNQAFAYTIQQDVIWTIFSYAKEYESAYEDKLNKVYPKEKQPTP